MNENKLLKSRLKGIMNLNKNRRFNRFNKSYSVYNPYSLALIAPLLIQSTIRSFWPYMLLSHLALCSFFFFITHYIYFFHLFTFSFCAHKYCAEPW